MSANESTLFEKIRIAASTGRLDDPNRVPTKKTIQPIRGNVDVAALAKQVSDIRELVDTLSGNSTDISLLDRALTVRDLVQGGLLTIEAGNKTVGTGGGLVMTNEGGTNLSGSASTIENITTITGIPYLPAAPTPTDLKASGTYNHVILTWVLPLYQNHGYTEVWRSTTNNLGTAIHIGDAVGQIYVDEATIDLGVTYYYWVREVTNDTIPMFSPYNAGVSGGTPGGAGQIGGEDLGPLIITAEKLARGTYDNINLVANGNFEDGLLAWSGYEGISGGGSLTIDTADKSSGEKSLLLTKAAGAAGVSVMGMAFPMIPGETYSLKLKIKSNDANGTIYVRIIEAAAASSLTPDGFIGSRDNFTDAIVGGTLPTAWTTSEVTYVARSGMYFGAVAVYFWSGGTATQMHVDEISVGRQITASFMAAGSIAVGSAAIENGAIRNALIANLAVDTAKIADLAVNTAKLADVSITNAKIVDATILGAKIGNAQIATAHIIDANITTAKIQDAAITDAKIGNVIQSASYVPGVSGWKLDKLGQLEANSATFRGTLSAATGTFAGSLSAATGTFAGSLSAATGTFAGALSAATGTFSGALSAASGTFAGTLTAAALTIAGQQIIVPVYAANNTTVGTPGSGFTTLMTTGLIDVGATGKIAVIVSIEWYATWSSDGTESGTGTLGVPIFAIAKNGTTVLDTWSPAVGSTYTTTRGNRVYILLDTPGAAATYQVRINAGGGGGGSLNAQILCIGARN